MRYLQEENARLREALEKIIEADNYFDSVYVIAHDALNPKEKEGDDGKFCHRCRFFGKDHFNVGRCQRRSPIHIEEGEPSKWPRVSDDDFCGEWEFNYE